MITVPKVRRVKDAEYLTFLRAMPCAVCAHLGEIQTTRTEAHHVRTRGAGGGDDTAVPCCARHHQEFHLSGRRSFGLKHRIDLLDIAGTLYAEWQRDGGHQ